MKVLGTIFALFLLTLISVVHGAGADDCVPSRSFSEEQPPSYCPSGYVVKGISCYGRYCDNKTLKCCRYTRTYDRSAAFGWSSWFSEESDRVRRNYAITELGFVVGVACRGAYCDDLRLNFMRSPNLQNLRQCYWTGEFSEEQQRGNTRECGSGYFVSGIKCTGPYCDNLNLYCCRARSAQ